MSQRGNRSIHQSEQQEERSLWQKVVNELKALMAHEARVNDTRRKIDTLEERGKRPDALTTADLQELMGCYKRLKSLSEEESRLLSHVIEHNLSILIGLRKATEQGYGNTAGRGVPPRVKRETVTAESPAGRSNKPRSMSVPNENGPILQVGSQVAFRLPKQKGAEGEWIQCDVINIIGEGNKRRYEVQDPEPDEFGNHGQIYKAQASQLIQIPGDSTGLPPYPNGKQVLARYPETTTFYKAEVIGTKRDGTCRLKFEGEEEVGKETEVERRLVLEIGIKQ